MDRIRSVIFDIDDTLYNYTAADKLAKAALADYCTEHDLMSPSEMIVLHDEMFHKQEQRLKDTAASHNRLIRYQMMLEEKQLPLFPHALNMAKLYWKTLLDVAVCEEGIVELFKALKEAHIQIGIGTNMTSLIQFEKIQRFGLAPYVDFMTTSEDAGVEKPHTAFFIKCAQKSGCALSECVFIGDSLKHDILGAKSANMNAVLYRPARKAKASAVPEDVGVISDYRSCLHEQEIVLGDIRISKK